MSTPVFSAIQRSLFALSLILSLGYAYGQDSTYNAIKLGWGLNNVMRQDLTFSPMIHKKWSAFNVTLQFERSRKLEQLATVQFRKYKPQIGESYEYPSYFNANTWSTHPHDFAMLDIHYAIGKVIHRANQRVITLGGRSRNRLWSSNYWFGDASYFGYYFAFGIDAWAKLNYKIDDKNALRSTLSVPLFSFIARNPYYVQNDWYFEDNLEHKSLRSLINFIGGSDLRSWGKSQLLDFDLFVDHQLTTKWNIGAGYCFSMNLNQSPTKLTSFENMFQFTGTLKF